MPLCLVERLNYKRLEKQKTQLLPHRYINSENPPFEILLWRFGRI